MEKSVKTKHKSNLYGVRLASFIVAIIELVESAGCIVAGLVMLITGIVARDGRGNESMVVAYVGIGLLASAILGLACTIAIIKLMKRSYSRTKFTVWGILGIISLQALVSGILTLVSKCTIKNNKQSVHTKK